MKVMETMYRNHTGVLDGGDPMSEQYSHARKYLEEHPTVNKVDTLSKDEWEAITLYLLFAFKKIS